MRHFWSWTINWIHFDPNDPNTFPTPNSIVLASCRIEGKNASESFTTPLKFGSVLGDQLSFPKGYEVYAYVPLPPPAIPLASVDETTPASESAA